VTWTIHPAARAPGKAAGVVGFILLSGLAAAEVGRGAGWGAVAIAFLTLSVSGFLWPTRYRLDERGVEVRHLGGTRRRAWSDLRRIERVPGGVLVSPCRRAGVRDRVRGIVLRTDGDAEDLLATVRRLHDAR